MLTYPVGADGRTIASVTNPIPILSSTDSRAPIFLLAAGTVLTRPANVTPYSADDAISDSATAGAVTALPVTISTTADEPVAISRIRLVTTDTGLGNGVRVRAWVYNSDPTASSGVSGGDNAAFNNKQAGYIGTCSGTFRAFSDGGGCVCVPDEGTTMITTPGTGVTEVWLQYQTLDGFIPSANSTTISPIVEAIQGATA